MSRHVALLAALALLVGPAVAVVQAAPSTISCFAVAPIQRCTFDSNLEVTPPFPGLMVCAGTEMDPDRCQPFPADDPLRGAGFTGSLEIAFHPVDGQATSGQFDCGTYVAGVQGVDPVGTCVYTGDQLDGAYSVTVTATPNVPGAPSGGAGAYELFVYG